MHFKPPTSYLLDFVETSDVAVLSVDFSGSVFEALLLLVGNSPFLRLMPCPRRDFCVFRIVAEVPMDLAVVFSSA